MSDSITTVRTDELRPGDRVWHPFDIVCFTVAHKPERVALDFEGERGLRVTGTDDRGETVHVDVSPAYRWHRGPKATAPTTHDPLVVNTKAGVCWTRRAVTSGGIALYAPEGIRTCPEFVMATEAELAEQGIVGSADVLPMPVAPEPQDAGARAKIAELIGDAKPAADGLLERLAESVRDRREHEHPTWEDLFCLNLTSWAGERMAPVLRRLLDAEARVAELEAAAQEIVGLHMDSPMGPCPVCIDADAMVRGDDYTLPYPCPTARLAGAKDCDPPSYRTADFFQPGRAYTHHPGPDSPGGPRLRFYCESVTTDRTTGRPIARGWGGRRYGDRWTSVQHTRGLEDWQSGAWVDTTAGGDDR